MRNIIESLSVEDRRKYDYDLLEQKYMENQNRIVDDEKTVEYLREVIKDKKVMLIAPGKSTITEQKSLQEFIYKEDPLIIHVNAINKLYASYYLFFTNNVRYEYASYAYPKTFKNSK